MPPFLPPPNSGGTRAFTNTFYGIAGLYPSSWRMDGIDSVPNDGLVEVAHIYHSSGAQERVDVGIDDQGTFGLTLEGYLQSTIDSYRNSYGTINVLVSDSQSNVAGRPAYRLVFTSGDGTDKVMETGFIVGDKVLYVAYTARPSNFFTYLEDAMYIANSIRMTR